MFVLSPPSQIHETVETINQLKTSREFFLSFTKNPQEFINNWLISQSRDLKVTSVSLFIYNDQWNPFFSGGCIVFVIWMI